MEDYKKDAEGRRDYGQNGEKRYSSEGRVLRPRKKVGTGNEGQKNYGEHRSYGTPRKEYGENRPYGERRSNYGGPRKDYGENRGYGERRSYGDGENRP